jgi:hypothetical protein
MLTAKNSRMTLSRKSIRLLCILFADGWSFYVTKNMPESIEEN